MGLFGPTKEEKNEQYQQGQEDAKNEDFVGGLFHAIGDCITTVVPSSEEHDAYEAGYHGKK